MVNLSDNHKELIKNFLFSINIDRKEILKKLSLEVDDIKYLYFIICENEIRLISYSKLDNKLTTLSIDGIINNEVINYNLFMTDDPIIKQAISDVDSMYEHSFLKKLIHTFEYNSQADFYHRYKYNKVFIYSLATNRVYYFKEAIIL